MGRKICSARRAGVAGPPILGRLRRQTDNQLSERSQVMARDMLEGVRLKSTTFVLIVLMLSSILRSGDVTMSVPFTLSLEDCAG